MSCPEGVKHDQTTPTNKPVPHAWWQGAMQPVSSPQQSNQDTVPSASPSWETRLQDPWRAIYRTENTRR